MEIFNWLTAGFAFLAALLWLLSALLKVKARENPDETGWRPFQIVVGNKRSWDLIETVKLQAKLSTWAAIAAALSALFHGLSILR